MRRAAGVAVAGVLLTLASLTFDAAPLFVPGVAFALLGTAAPLWVYASARGATIDRRLAADRVLEGEPVEATVAVQRGLLGLPGGEILDPLAGRPVPLGRSLSPIRGGARGEVRIVARFTRRGLQRLEPPSLLLQDSLGLARAQRASSDPPQELLILPRTEPVRWVSTGRARWAEGGAGAAAGDPPAAVDVDGLRPYRPGTPASRIHWAALARGAGLLERRLQPDADTRALIVLDARGSGPPEYLDCAVRAAASLTLELARHGGCQLLLPGDRRALAIETDLIGWPGVHARLAMVRGGPDAHAPLLGSGSRLGPVFYVAAQTFERLPAALSGTGAPATALVLPAPLRPRATGEPSFEVSGCRGYVLGARTGRQVGGRQAA